MEISTRPTSLAIVPQPPPPGLYVTLGPDFLVGWALQILTQKIANPARIVWVDAANAFNAYIVSLSARRVYKDPAETLQSFLVARPFTAYQLETMISEKLLPASRRACALLSVVADPLRLFADAEGRDTQIRFCYNRFIRGVRAVAKETAVLILAPGEARGTTGLLYSATRITQLERGTHGPYLTHHHPAHPF